ncbi:MAG: carboxy-S-adenosyl-L-methionine synthase CmoA [Salinispira sp.]
MKRRKRDREREKPKWEPKQRDRLFSVQQSSVDPFTFNKQVAQVFPDMLKRSIPAYESTIEMIGFLARRFVQPHTNCYDLGTGCGAALQAMRENVTVPGCVMYGIDSSSDMLDTCRARSLNDGSSSSPRIIYVCADIAEQPMENASMIVLNFTLQFLPPHSRQNIIQRVYDSLCPGGICLISEKIVYGNAWQQKLATSLHEDFKRSHGYSELEISQKRQSLEDVLIPNRGEDIENMLAHAGFQCVFPWLRYVNFSSFLSVKGDDGARGAG